MADELVTVEAVQWHTLNGQIHDVGDTYQTDDAMAATLAVQGKAKRVDAAAPAPAKASKPVEPLTTEDFAKHPVSPAAALLASKAKARTVRASKPAKAKASKPVQRRTVTKPLRKAKRGTAAKRKG